MCSKCVQKMLTEWLEVYTVIKVLLQILSQKYYKYLRNILVAWVDDDYIGFMVAGHPRLIRATVS